jgi:hypothetical protein
MNLLELRTHLTELHNRTIAPASIVGRGYKNPRAAAANWLYRELYNLVNPYDKVDECSVKSDGKPFSTEAKAMNSQLYKAAKAGTVKLLNDATVTDFGVKPTSEGDGYMAFIRYQVKRG